MSELKQKSHFHLACIECGKTYDLLTVVYQCTCFGLLEIRGDFHKIPPPSLKILGQRRTSHESWNQSGVWRFREALVDIPRDDLVIHPEGNTRLYQRAVLSEFADTPQLWFKHEGENPTGSFKDRGMTVAVSMARHLKKKIIACASTGNTSAALAAYASQALTRGIVFVPDGKISQGKLAQAVGYGAKILAIKGDFDAAMDLVQQAAKELDLYMVNSLNPFRIEGQKTIVWELMEQLDWNPPDWIVLPAGNLGNTSAFGKAIKEAHEFGWISKKPRLASIQAEGASPFYESFKNGFSSLTPMKAETFATAIRIGMPVNWTKAKKAILETQGVVAKVSDAEIRAAKLLIDKSGVGCEPASAASLAGLKKLRASGVIQKSESCVCVLTGHILKDTDAIMEGHHLKDMTLSPIEPRIEAVARALAI